MDVILGVGELRLVPVVGLVPGTPFYMQNGGTVSTALHLRCCNREEGNVQHVSVTLTGEDSFTCAPIREDDEQTEVLPIATGELCFRFPDEQPQNIDFRQPGLLFVGGDGAYLSIRWNGHQKFLRFRDFRVVEDGPRNACCFSDWRLVSRITALSEQVFVSHMNRA